MMSRNNRRTREVLKRLGKEKVAKVEKPYLFRKKKTIADALWKTQSTFDGYEKKLRKRVRQLKMSKADTRRFEALSGYRPMASELRYSDIPARRKFAKLIVREVRHLERNDPDLQFMFLTLLADEGITSDRRPACYIDQLIDKARRAMTKLGVDGIAVLEQTALMNYPQKGFGRSIMLHVHMLIWFNPQYQRLPDPGYDLSPNRGYPAWKCKLGADPIRVTRLTPAMGTAAYWAAYMLKGPHEAKNRIKTGTQPPFEEFKLMKTTKGYRPEFAMRLHELSSQLPLTALSWGTKGGATILGRCRKQIRQWASKRTYAKSMPVQPFNEKRFWKRTHRMKRKTYQPFFIFGPTIN